MNPGSELFPGATASETEIDEILANEALNFEASMPQDQTHYINQRRILIGPIADINHPEFGRENLPSETYAVFYHIRLQDTMRIFAGTNRPQKSVIQVIQELVFDNDNNWLSFED